MLSVGVADGAIFYGQPRRRTVVCFDAELRIETETLVARLHVLNAARTTPKARYEKKCDRCSLYSICLPKTTGAANAQKYLKRAVATAIAGPAELVSDSVGAVYEL